MSASEAKGLVVKDSNGGVRDGLNFRGEWRAHVIAMEDGGVVGPDESGELVVVGGEGEVDEEGEDLSCESCRNGGKKKKNGLSGRHGEKKMIIHECLGKVKDWLCENFDTHKKLFYLFCLVAYSCMKENYG